MTKTKNSTEEPEIDELSAFARALSHPVRLKILQILNEKNACICNDLVIRLPVAQSTVSQHLKELRKAGLIQGEIDGPRVCYCLNPNRISELKDLFTNFFNTFKDSSK